MSDEVNIRDAIGEAPPPADGIGMKIADVQKLLNQQHGTLLGNDDPLLLLVTMNNAFLAEYEQMLKRHNDALGDCLATEAEKYLTDVRESADRLSRELSSASVQAHGGALRAFQSNMVWLSVIVALSAIINVAALLLRVKGVI